jgi:hypothetical protein
LGPGAILTRTRFSLHVRTQPSWFTSKEALAVPIRNCSLSETPAMTTRLHDYAEVRAYLEKEHPDWLRALTPRHINAPADYWPQKVLTVSSVNAAMQNYVSIHEHQTRPNPALAAVHGQAALLLRYEVPSYYVSRELLTAALRTELPDDMVFEAIPFPFDALVFMLPKESWISRSRLNRTQCW